MVLAVAIAALFAARARTESQGRAARTAIAESLAAGHGVDGVAPEHLIWMQDNAAWPRNASDQIRSVTHGPRAEFVDLPRVVAAVRSGDDATAARLLGLR